MEKLKKKLKKTLDTLIEQIMESINNYNLNDANFYFDQYIELSPNSVERYALESMIRVSEGRLDLAEETLIEGLSYYPLSFNLLYNLAYILEQNSNYFDAYNIYMKARYSVETKEEKKDIRKAFKRLAKVIGGRLQTLGSEVTNILIAGNIKMEQKSNIEYLLRRKGILDCVGKNISKDAYSVLEIDFIDEVISKNLNYYGYDVTAVTEDKESVLNVIIKEWHDNILQPDQKVAKFYDDKLSLEWAEKIPEFDVIISISDNNFSIFDSSNKEELLELLIEKAKKQLIIKVSTNNSKITFNKEDLLNLAKKHDLKLDTILIEEEHELISVGKVDMNKFSVPTALESVGSKSIILDVDLKNCTDLYATGYIDDLHPFVELLKEYEENPDIIYEDSILYRYYKNYNPENLREHLFTHIQKAQRLNKGWIRYPWMFDKEQRVIFTDTITETRPGGIHFFGPNTDEFGEAEFQRLVSLYKYFKAHGYHPELFADGYISGYLLIKDNDYRFLVAEGQHRVACLAALGHESIRVRLTQMDNYPNHVNVRNIKDWPQVANGVYSRNLARSVFNRFFDENVGRDRIKNVENKIIL